MEGLDPRPEPAKIFDTAVTGDDWVKLRTEAIFRETLKDRTFTIVWTDNQRRYMTAEITKDDIYQYRLNRIFLSAPREVLEAAAGYLVRRTRKRRDIIHGYIETHMEHLAKTRVNRRYRLNPQGTVFDLEEIKDMLVDLYFDGDLPVSMTWGSRRTTINRHRISLASYSQATNIVRVHPVLDNDLVPIHFIAYVIHHELVHAKIKAREKDGRRYFHDEEFYEELHRYPLWEKAELWEKEALPSLLLAWKP